jgi:hypothetical protein
MAIDNSDYRGLVVIVPTRNRSAMAIQSILSILDEQGDDVTILVSDNCTEPEESKVLSEFCKARGGRSLRYMRPDRPLSMPMHYEWAFTQALETTSSNHFTILTDRRQFRKKAVAELCSKLVKFPNHIIAYQCDEVYDHTVPCQVAIKPWSGHVYRCRTADILEENARMRAWEFVPVLLNSVINRAVLLKIRSSFGDYCLSIAPDICCGIRTLAVEEEILFFDKPLLFNWGRGRSNGFSFTRGVTTKDSHDFEAQMGGAMTLHATPLPQVAVCNNANIHEYLVVKNQTSNIKFKDLEMSCYIDVLNNEINCFENYELKSYYKKILMQFDPSAELPDHVTTEWAPVVFDVDKMSPKDLMKTLLVNEYTRGIWWRFFRHFGVPLPKRHRANFASQDHAVYYAKNYRQTPSQDHLPGWCREAVG